MNQQHLIAEALLIKLEKQEQALHIVAEEAIGTIHNICSPLALLVVEDITELNTATAKISLERLIDTQSQIVEVRNKIKKVKEQLNG